jgi:hypothetical protein
MSVVHARRPHRRAGALPLLWAGDQSVDFSRHDGIGTVITAALSSGLVGNAFSHSDVGGYTSLFGNVRTAGADPQVVRTGRLHPGDAHPRRQPARR